MTLVSWRHNDRRMQWEAHDEIEGVVATITDAALEMMPPDALREFWASAMFMRKVANETHPSGADDDGDGGPDGVRDLHVLHTREHHPTSLGLGFAFGLGYSFAGSGYGDGTCPAFPGHGAVHHYGVIGGESSGLEVHPGFV